MKAFALSRIFSSLTLETSWSFCNFHPPVLYFLAKLSVQLFDEMRKRDMKGKYGMVTMCVGTGQGAAGIYEFLK